MRGTDANEETQPYQTDTHRTLEREETREAEEGEGMRRGSQQKHGPRTNEVGKNKNEVISTKFQTPISLSLVYYLVTWV